MGSSSGIILKNDLHSICFYLVFASKGEFARRPKMDRSVAEQVLDELFPSFEALETQSAAIVQFLKGKGIATDEQLAPYFEQAKNASSVRWHAARIRMERLLSTATKTVEQATEKGPAKLHKRLLKRPGTPPPKQFTGRIPKRKATPPTRQPRISPQAQRRTAERTMTGRRLDQANSREKRQPRREPLLLHPTAPGPQWCLRRRSGRQRSRLRRPCQIFQLRWS